MRANVKNRSSGSGWRRFLMSALFGVGFVLTGALQALAAPSFQEAVADYNAGQYAKALGKLEAVKASYPTNALVHYYMALCQQAVGHLAQAKVEYQWVIASRDPRLAPMATTGLSQLSGVRTTGGGSSSSSGGGSSGSAPMASSSGGSGQSQAKVAKIIEFWATW